MWRQMSRWGGVSALKSCGCFCCCSSSLRVFVVASLRHRWPLGSTAPPAVRRTHYTSLEKCIICLILCNSNCSNSFILHTYFRLAPNNLKPIILAHKIKKGPIWTPLTSLFLLSPKGAAKSIVFDRSLLQERPEWRKRKTNIKKCSGGTRLINQSQFIASVTVI